MSFVPQPNSSGKFKLKAPFDKLITPEVVYVCRSLRSINDYLAASETVFDSIYAPVGLTEAQYNADLLDNTFIAGLQAGTGEWVYVPCTYIESAPDVNGVVYSSIVIGIGLGAIPDELALDALKAKLKDATVNVIGIDPTIKAVLVAEPALIPRDKHEQLETIRTAKITDNESDYLRAERYKQQYEQLLEQHNQLQQWIQQNMTLA